MVWFYHIEDIKHFKVFDTNLDDYYTREETNTILGTKNHILQLFTKEGEIEPVKLNARNYYSKKLLKKLQKMKESKEKYCPANEIVNICGVTVNQPTAVLRKSKQMPL